MRPAVEHVVYPEGASFACLAFDGPTFDCPYHVHDEVELLLVGSSHGRRLVGDHVGRFVPGDLYLFGAGLAHMFYNEPEGLEPGEASRARSRYVQFREDCLGPCFFDRPEMRSVRRLLDAAGRGLLWPDAAASTSAARLATMDQLDGPGRLVALLQTLAELAGRVDEAVVLASAGYDPGEDVRHSERLRQAIDYVHRHLAESVSLEGAARAAGLSPQAFSRFFHRHRGQRFIDYVVELRLSEASRLLLETDRSVSDIAMAVGFNNLSNFNRHFLRRKGMTPSRLRASRRELSSPRDATPADHARFTRV